MVYKSTQEYKDAHVGDPRRSISGQLAHLDPLLKLRLGTSRRSPHRLRNPAHRLLLPRESEGRGLHRIVHEEQLWRRAQESHRKRDRKGRLPRHGQWQILRKADLLTMVQVQQRPKSPLQLHRVRPLLPPHALHRRNLLPHPRRCPRTRHHHRKDFLLGRIRQWRTQGKNHRSAHRRSGPFGAVGTVARLCHHVHPGQGIALILAIPISHGYR